VGSIAEEELIHLLKEGIEGGNGGTAVKEIIPKYILYVNAI
jgi:hypothetical protein